MTGDNRIVAIGSETPAELDANAVDGAVDHAVDDSEDAFDAEEEWIAEPVNRPPFRWVFPTLAIASIAAWTAFYAWLHWEAMIVTTAPGQWIDWVSQWSVPVLLIMATWLIVMRSSTREAQRFGDAANLLSRESAQLESRLVAVNRELSMAREFLGAQSRDLESLGRIATQRLSENADRLQSLIANNGAEVQRIGSVSTTALENMDRLRNELPVIANSARDVTSQIGQAGITAAQELGRLSGGLERVEQLGSQSEAHALAVETRLASTMDQFENQLLSLEKQAEERFDVLRSQSETFRTDLDSREIDALAAIKRRADTIRAEIDNSLGAVAKQEKEGLAAWQARIMALRGEGAALSGELRAHEEKALGDLKSAIERMREEIGSTITELDELDRKALLASRDRVRSLGEEAARFDSRLRARNAQFDEELEVRENAQKAREAQAMAALARKLGDLDQAIASRREAQIAHDTALTQSNASLGDAMSHLETRLAAVVERSNAVRDQLNEGLDQLDHKLAANGSNLEAQDAAIAQLTDSSVRLLELVQASAQHSREILPEALGEAEQRLTETRDKASEIRSLLDEASSKGTQLAEQVDAARATHETLGDEIDDLGTKLGSSSEISTHKLAALRDTMVGLHGEADRLAERSDGELQEKIANLSAASKAALTAIAAVGDEELRALADRLGQEAHKAVSNALETDTEEAIASLGQAANKAAELGRDTTAQLRDQLMRVDDLTGNLEQRIARARERAEEQVDNDFSRRVALISEALDSNAIDIAKAMDSDVSDTSWTSYLRGDRGIFTRRAVRLLDHVTAHEIAEIYDVDGDFREHVSRYIHDFESMLRTVLSTRDGNALAVTLLSSDNGKLYVALAQAIERLRD